MMSTKHKDMNNKATKVIVFSLVVVFIFLLNFKIHLDYDYIYHLDEWDHVSYAKKINEEGSYRFIDQNFVSRSENEVITPHYESGFHIFLAELFLVTDLDPVLDYKFLAALFACITAFILFTIVLHLTKDFYTGIFAMLFFASLKSNVNILGSWFFIPLTFSFAFIYFFIHSVKRGVEENNNKFLIVSAILFLTMFIVHPSTGMIALIIAAIFIFTNKKFVKRHKKLITAGIVSISLIILIILTIKSSLINNLNNLPNLISFIFSNFGKAVGVVLDKISFFNYGPGPHIKYNFITQYGIVLSMLGVAGFFTALKDKKYRIFLVWLGFTFFFLLTYQFFEFTLFASQRRIIYYALLVSVIFSAIGLQYFFSEFKQFMLKKKVKEASINTIKIIIFGLILFYSFFNYYTTPKGVELYEPVSGSEYDSLMTFKERFGEKKLVYSPDFKLTNAIYASTDSYPLISRINKIDGKPIELFINESCPPNSTPQKIRDIDFIITHNPLNCSTFELVQNDSLFIYKRGDLSD